MLLFLCFFFFLLASSASQSDCDHCVVKTKAAYFSKPSALSAGACGFGSYAITMTSNHLAAAFPSLYKDGVGCGACFQVRCKNTTLCTKKGSKIVVTDINPNNQTDFVLSGRAFKAMARKGLGLEILKQKIVDVEYKRVPCVYKKNNYTVYVEETSKPGEYLAVKFLYQGGQTEILFVEVASVSSSWPTSMSRKGNSAIWETSNVPTGPLRFHVAVMGGYDMSHIWADSVMPADWKAGVTYDMGEKVTAIKADGCAGCDDGTWK